MLIAIDNGNTNVKFALVGDQGAILHRWSIATDAKRTADEYAVWLDQLLRMEGYARSDVTDVIIATVVPRALHNLQVLAQKYFGTDALIAGKPPVEWGKRQRLEPVHRLLRTLDDFLDNQFEIFDADAEGVGLVVAGFVGEDHAAL